MSRVGRHARRTGYGARQQVHSRRVRARTDACACVGARGIRRPRARIEVPKTPIRIPRVLTQMHLATLPCGFPFNRFVEAPLGDNLAPIRCLSAFSGVLFYNHVKYHKNK